MSLGRRIVFEENTNVYSMNEGLEQMDTQPVSRAELDFSHRILIAYDRGWQKQFLFMRSGEKWYQRHSLLYTLTIPTSMSGKTCGGKNGYMGRIGRKVNGMRSWYCTVVPFALTLQRLTHELMASCFLPTKKRI